MQRKDFLCTGCKGLHFRFRTCARTQFLFISLTASGDERVGTAGVLLSSRQGHEYFSEKQTGITAGKKRELAPGSRDPDIVLTPFWVCLLPVYSQY